MAHCFVITNEISIIIDICCAIAVIFAIICVFNKRCFLMRVSYKKLWKLLIDKDMNKTDLRHATGISTSTIAKLSKGGDVTVSILTRICAALGCDLGDIMEIDQSVKREMLGK